MTLTLKQKIFAVLATLTVVVAATATAGWISLQLSNDGLRTVHDDRVIPLKQLKAISDAYAVNVVDAAHKVRNGALALTEGLKGIDSATAEIESQWKSYTATQLTPDERRLVNDARRLMTTADASIATLRRLIAAKDQSGIDGYVVNEMYPTIEPVTEKISELIELQLHEAAREFAAASEVFATSKLVQIVLIVIALVAVGVGVQVTVRGIIRPIAGMTSAMEKLASGDKSIVVPSVGRADEIGAMAAAVQIFKDNMIKAEQLEAEQKAAQEKQLARAKAVEGYIASFDSSVTGVLQMVSSASTELQSTAQSMSATAEETSRQATAVAAASEQASTNVQTVASAAEELSSSIAEISRQVAESAKIAGQASEQAGATNAQIKGLAEAAQRIGDVVKLINDIASQTNLLALNATIEAARAGEAGKGFAVVASEVKSLANQTAKATEEISAKISEMQAATGQSVEAIGEITGTIGRINEIATTIASAVEEQGAATQEIARNVQQASKGTGEVSANIGGVTKAATDTGAAASQVLGASGELSQQSETLRNQVDGFLQKIRAA